MARITNQRVELDEAEKSRLDEKHKLIQAHLSEQPELLVTYFQADNHKSGGSYLTVRGRVEKVNVYDQVLVISDGLRIFIGDIYEVNGEIFEEY